MVQQRRYARAPFGAPVLFSVKGNAEEQRGVARDIAVGGTFLETATPAAFGAEVIVHLTLPGADEPSALPGVVRWVNDSGMGIQFGLLGAVETHLITEIGRKRAESVG